MPRQPDPHSPSSQAGMSVMRLRLLNSVLWAVMLLACAVVLAGSDQGAFIGVLVVLLCGAVGSDQLIMVFSRRSDGSDADATGG